MMTLKEMRQNAVIDALDDLERARECWCRWHNAMSRKWFRDCLAEYRMAVLIFDLT